jgi:hypothetical protein
MKKRSVAALIAAIVASGAIGSIIVGQATAAGENPKAWGAGADGYWGASPGVEQQVLKKNLTTPGAGALMIVGTVTAEDDCSIGDIGVLVTRLQVDGIDVWSSDDFTAQSTECLLAARQHRGIAFNFPSDTVTMTAVVPVDAGDHSVKILALEVGTGSYVTSRGLSIVFVPTGTGPFPWPQPVKP